MNKPLVIGVAGISRCGKNTFCDLLKKELEARDEEVCNLSFALSLREETESFLKNHFNFNVWLDTDKEKFRPFLIWFSNLKREQTNGRYFIDKLNQKLLPLKDSEIIFTISDLRFAKNFEYDELDFVKEYGLVVHIRKYKMRESAIKIFDLPPNEFEAKNDPILKSAADYLIEWQDQDGKIENLKPHVDKFVDWLVENKYI